MHTLSPDTHSKVEQLHIELLRKSPIFRRLQIVASLVNPHDNYPGRVFVNVTRMILKNHV